MAKRNGDKLSPVKIKKLRLLKEGYFEISRITRQLELKATADKNRMNYK